MGLPKVIFIKNIHSIQLLLDSSLASPLCWVVSLSFTRSLSLFCPHPWGCPSPQLCSGAVRIGSTPEVHLPRTAGCLAPDQAGPQGAQGGAGGRGGSAGLLWCKVSPHPCTLCHHASSFTYSPTMAWFLWAFLPCCLVSVLLVILTSVHMVSPVVPGLALTIDLLPFPFCRSSSLLPGGSFYFLP
jgi:hypothetical protein